MRALVGSTGQLALVVGCGTDLLTAPAAEGGGVSDSSAVVQNSTPAEPSSECVAGAHPITFISNRAGPSEWQLFSMVPDSGETTSISRGHFRGPVWSPRGESIAFRYHYIVDYQPDFATAIGVMAADGSQRVTLVTEDSGKSARLGSYRSIDVPSWSANGELVAFAAQMGSPDEFRAWVVSRFGGEPRLLLPDFGEQHAWPSFNPVADARDQIAVVSRAESDAGWIGADVWVGEVGRSASLRNVTQGRVFNPEAPRWSPDGRYLAFSAESTPADPESREIYVLETDSGELSRVTFDATADVHAAWSPDASALLVSSEREQEGRAGRLAGEEVGLWVVPLAAPELAWPVTPSAGGHGMGDWLWADRCGR